MRIYLQSAATESEVTRFYQIILQPDLLQGWNVIREWGKQGSPGRVKKDHYTKLDDAQNALMESRDKQLGKGFRVVFVEGLEAPS